MKSLLTLAIPRDEYPCTDLGNAGRLVCYLDSQRDGVLWADIELGVDPYAVALMLSDLVREDLNRDDLTANRRKEVTAWAAKCEMLPRINAAHKIVQQFLILVKRFDSGVHGSAYLDPEPRRLGDIADKAEDAAEKAREANKPYGRTEETEAEVRRAEAASEKAWDAHGYAVSAAYARRYAEAIDNLNATA